MPTPAPSPAPTPAASPEAVLEPLPTEDWSAVAAAHLLRRAGFGGTPAEVQQLAALSPAQAVARLVDTPEEEPELERAILAEGSTLALVEDATRGNGRDPIDVLRAWWLFRLAHTRRPLREKLTLFWHGHFACSAGKVNRAPLLRAQNDVFRRLGQGRFRDLLGAIARDAAMLVFLDGRLNRAGQPNENWARELMELFALGVDRYTQRDVAELARVFTGWSTPHPDALEFVFVPEDHDAGDKVLFGEPLRGRAGADGVQEGEQALDRIVARPECADFLAGKLLGFFAGPSWPPQVQAALAQTLRQHDLEIAAALRALFASRWFHAPERRFAQHKSGVETAISAARLLGVKNAHLIGLESALRRLGMELFLPPSVAGWGSGRTWVQTGALVERWRLARTLAELPHTRLVVRGSPAIDLEALAPAPDAGDEDLVDALAARLLQRPLRGRQRETLLRYLAGCAGRTAGAQARDVRRAKLRGLAHLLLATPEFGLA